MELTLKRLLEQAEFTQVRKGGYDRDEVNGFLDRAVAMAAKVEAKLTETMEAASRGGAPADVDIEAEVARGVQARLAEQPPAPAPAPAAPAGPSDEERAEEVRRTLVMAQRTADAAVREAREDAARILAEANAEASKTRTELAAQLETERTEARDRIRTEITQLEGVRESLRTDVGLLERHVEEQRNQLRSTLGELQRLLDDPSGFRLAPSPALLDPEVPEPDATPLVDGAAPEAAPAPAPEAPAPAPIVAEPPAAPAAPVAAEPPAIAPVEEPEPPAAPPAAPNLSFGDVEHAPPGRGGAEATQPVRIVADDDDPFMAELRKAIDDDEPLGPRDPAPVQEPEERDEDRRGWRFGRH